MCVRTWMWMPEEPRRGCSIFWCGSYRQLLSCQMWVLATELGSSARAEHILNHWTILPARYSTFRNMLFVGPELGLPMSRRNLLSVLHGHRANICSAEVWGMKLFPTAVPSWSHISCLISEDFSGSSATALPSTALLPSVPHFCSLSSAVCLWD